MDSLKARRTATTETIDAASHTPHAATQAATKQDATTPPSEAPLAKGLAHKAPAKKTSTLEKGSLWDTRAQAKLPRVTPKFEVDCMRPGDTKTLNGAYTVKGNGYTSSAYPITVTAIKDGVVFENLVSDILGPYEDVVLHRGANGAYTGTARHGEWHLLQPSTLGVARLAFVPNGDFDKRYVDIELTQLNLTGDLSALDGRKVRATSEDGANLNFTTRVGNEAMILKGAHGVTLTFADKLDGNGGFAAKENDASTRGFIRFDTTVGEYKLSVVHNGKLYAAQLSQPDGRPKTAPSYRAIVGTGGPRDLVAHVEAITLEDGLTALRFSRAHAGKMPALVYLHGNEATDSQGEPVVVTKHGKNLELTTAAGQVYLQAIQPKHDFDAFEGRTIHTKVYGPATSTGDAPGFGDADVSITFETKAEDGSIAARVAHGNEAVLATAATRDDEGGWILPGQWITYRLTPRAAGGYDLTTTWSAHDFSSDTPVALS